MMEFLNAWEGSTKHETQSTKHETLNIKNETQSIKHKTLSVEHAKEFLQILAPFAPFMTEEIWRNVFGEKESIHLSSWPRVDEKSLVEEEIKIPVQVNGKVRAVIVVQADDIIENTVVNKAIENEKVKKYLEGKKYKTIYVKGKILNFVLTTF